MALEEALGIWLGWGSPIGIGIFLSGLGILFWGLAKFLKKKE